VTPEIVSRERVYDRWLRLDRLMIRMPDGELGERHLEDHGSAVAVLPYDPVRRIATLVRQPRASVLAAGEEPVLELSAGCIEAEPPEAAARRETLEEAGLAVSALEPVTCIWSMVGISTERMHIFLAPYSAADQVTRGGGAADENEGIEVVEVQLAELAGLARRGELTDAKTLIAVQALILRRPELFS
jgi:nudix-type nucleoside diphosphatase (YffH/AdpP family)